jgi:hypothetical protein
MNDENSRAKVQNVGADSSAGTLRENVVDRKRKSPISNERQYEGGTTFVAV